MKLVKGLARRSCSEDGFSLIEICITISLFLLIVTITFPGLWFLRQQQLVSEVDKLHSVFSYLQQAAIASNRDYVLKFNIESNTYVFENTVTKLSEHTKFAIKTGVKGPPSTPVSIITKPITFIKNEVIFFANGTIQPGTAYLTDSKYKYLYAITVPISQVSLIRKYKYTNKWVLIE